MTTQVINSGASVRIIVQSRGIAGTAINASGHLIVTYDDGTTEDAGFIGGGGTPTPTPTPTTYMMDFRVPANARYLGAML